MGGINSRESPEDLMEAIRRSDDDQVAYLSTYHPDYLSRIDVLLTMILMGRNIDDLVATNTGTEAMVSILLEILDQEDPEKLSKALTLPGIYLSPTMIHRILCKWTQVVNVKRFFVPNANNYGILLRFLFVGNIETGFNSEEWIADLSSEDIFTELEGFIEREVRYIVDIKRVDDLVRFVAKQLNGRNEGEFISRGKLGLFHYCLNYHLKRHMTGLDVKLQKTIAEGHTHEMLLILYCHPPVTDITLRWILTHRTSFLETICNHIRINSDQRKMILSEYSSYPAQVQRCLLNCC